MTTLQEALPCPFCGKQHTLQVISGQELMDENQEFWQHSESFGVVCDASTPDGKGGCGAMGGFKPTEDEAIEAWNTRTALAQQREQPVAYITDTEQGPMVWTPEMYGEACTYCDDGEFPVPLYTAAPAPAPAPQPAQGEPVAWTHSCNALCTDGLELWIDHCPHCGKPRTAHAEQWPPGLITDIVLTVTALHKEVDIGWSPDARSHLLRLSTSIGMLAAAPAPQAQDKSDNYLSGYCTGRTDLLKEQSAQPVAQPLSDDQIEDIGFEMLPEAQRKDFIEFARAIEAAHGIREVK